MEENFVTRLQSAANNPGEFFNRHFGELRFDNDHDDIETLICLLISNGTRLSSGEFGRIKEQIVTHPKYATNLEYQFFNNVACAYNYSDKQNYESSRIFYLMAHEISLLMNDRDKMVLSLSGLAAVYNEEGEFDKAREFIDDAVNLLGFISDPNRIAQTFYIYASILGNQKEPDKAVKAAKKAVRYYREIENYQTRYYYTMSLLLLSGLLYKNGEDEEAGKVMAHGINSGEKNGHLNALENHMEVVAHYYGQTGDLEKALAYQKTYSDYLKARNVRPRSSGEYRETVKTAHIDSLRYLLIKNEGLQMRINDLYKQLSAEEKPEKRNNESFKVIQKALSMGDFHTWYQLIWSAADRKFTRAEALTRWINPEGTNIPPDVFIEYLENSELSLIFLQKLISDSTDFYSRLRKAGVGDFTISINVSPYQLSNLNIVSLLETACLKNEINPSSIQIEITERMVLIKDIETLDKLFKLKELGFRIALDDFGTGFSSLECLRTLNLDVVKLDRSLVRDIHKDEKGERLLKGIIHMLNDLKYQVVCEGIETQEEADLVSGLGCSYHQGYLYHEAAPADDVLALLKS